MVAFQNPLDQYFMKHPDDFFGRPHEQAIIDLKNQYISLGHIMCAASEMPLTEKDKEYFPQLFQESIKALEQQNLIRNTPRGWVYSGTARPVEIVNLESISDKTVTVTCDGKILETLPLTKAYEEVHQGAVLLHQGETYISEELDLGTLTAKVRKEDVDYYTEALKTVDVRIKNVFETKLCGVPVSLGELLITETYHEYIVKSHDVVVERISLRLPPVIFSTVGVWFTLPEEIQKEIEERQLDYAGGLHATEHAMIAMAPIFAMCDRWDIGGLSTPLHPDTGKPTIFIYDGFEGGIGISETLYASINKLWKKTLQLIETCECDEGCPSCIYSPKCGNENKPLDKKAARVILQKLVERASPETEKNQAKENQQPVSQQR
jgi:DEAD/DEAH box helicase domain-containing protein